MADAKISALPAVTTPLAGTEVLPIVQSGVTKKATVVELTADKAPLAAPSFTGDVSATTGNFVIGTAGKGIDFSATTSGTGTMTSELFSDYEQGTFTPNITFGGGSTDLTYTARNGVYTKIGNLVFFRIGIDINSKGSSTGNMAVTGLPFTSASGSYSDWPCSAQFFSFTGLTGAVGGFVGANATSVTVTQSISTGNSSITDANAASGIINLAGFYQTTS
jgi:hypothetical protein